MGLQELEERDITQSHEFVDLDGAVLLSIEERPNNQMAFVGPTNLRGREMRLFVPTEHTDGVARAVVGARIGVCKTHAGIRAARLCLVAMHNHGITRVHVLHGYMVSSVVL